MKSFSLIGLVFLTSLTTSYVLSDDPQTQESSQKEKIHPANPKPPFTISKETTYLTKPLRDDGYVDYVAALNKISSEGVTPENNAVVLLMQAIGPKVIWEKERTQFFHMLGIEPLPEQGDYFISFEDYLKQIDDNKGGATTPLDSAESAKLSDQFYKMTAKPWSEEKYPLFAEWLKANQKPLEKIHKATQRQKVYAPLTGRLLCVVSGEPLHSSRDCGQLLIIRAMNSIRQGKIEDAREDILACHRLARLVAQDPRELGGILFLGIEERACSGDVALAQSGKLSSRDLARFVRELQTLPSLPKLADKIDSAARFEFLDDVASVAREEEKHLYSRTSPRKSSLGNLFIAALTTPTDWNGILQTSNSWFDRMAEVCRKSTFIERMDAYKNLQIGLKKDSAEAKAVQRSILGQQKLPIGGTYQKQVEILIYLNYLGLESTLKFEERIRVRSDLSQLALALATYRSKQESYPDRLNELAAKYITEIPKDRFSNTDLIYRREGNGYLLYSVGPNGKDDDGKDRESDPSGESDDVVIRTPKEAK